MRRSVFGSTYLLDTYIEIISWYTKCNENMHEILINVSR